MRYKERTHECNRNVCKETNKIEDQYITHNSEQISEQNSEQINKGPIQTLTRKITLTIRNKKTENP